MLRTFHPIKLLFGTNQEALVSESSQKSYPVNYIIYNVYIQILSMF